MFTYTVVSRDTARVARNILLKHISHISNSQAQRFALERQKVRTQSTWRSQPEQRSR